LSENQLYSLSRFNKLSLTKVNSENKLKFKRFRSLEKKAKQKIVKVFSLKSPKSFFNIKEVDGYAHLKEEFRESNLLLSNLGFVDIHQLKTYKYLV
jgi:hypothetical protein